MSVIEAVNVAGVKEAQQVFSHIITSMGIGDHKVKNFTQNVAFKFLSDPYGYLGNWMITSDEIAISLTGSRIWDAMYLANEADVICGILPKTSCDYIKSKSDSIDPDLYGDTLESYKVYPLCRDNNVEGAMAYLIARYALYQSVQIELDNSIRLIQTYNIPVSSDFNFDKVDQVIPILSQTLIQKRMFEDFILEVQDNYPAQENELNRAVER